MTFFISFHFISFHQPILTDLSHSSLSSFDFSNTFHRQPITSISIQFFDQTTVTTGHGRSQILIQQECLIKTVLSIPTIIAFPNSEGLTSAFISSEESMFDTLQKEGKREGWMEGMIRNSCFMRLFVIIRVDRVISQFWRGNEYSDLCVSGNGME
jgi:hypothetical protein